MEQANFSTSDNAQQHNGAAKPHVVILKWNPSFSSYRMTDHLLIMVDLINGESEYHHNWSVHDYTIIRPGDRFYFVKVGYGQTGIVGCGTITSDPYKDQDWSGQGRDTYYVDFVPDVFLNPDALEILTSAVLTRLIPDFDWYRGHSGIVLNEAQGDALNAAWSKYMARMKSLFELKMQREDQDYVYIRK